MSRSTEKGRETDCHLGGKRLFKISGTEPPKRDAVLLLQLCERGTVLYGRYIKELKVTCFWFMVHTPEASDLTAQVPQQGGRTQGVENVQCRFTCFCNVLLFKPETALYIFSLYTQLYNWVPATAMVQHICHPVGSKASCYRNWVGLWLCLMSDGK